MPPKAAAQRKGPAFKPPRPVKVPTQATKSTSNATSKRAPNNVASKPPAAKKAATAPSRPSFQIPTLISSSEDEAEENALSNSDDDRDELMDDASEEERPPPATPQTSANPIPQALLARLLHEGFEDKGTQIQKGAMELTAKYMEIFVREAIARARFERSDAQRGGNDGFLQVEDLERLAPQLLLDF